MADLPPELFLAGYPDPLRTIAEQLRVVVRAAVPDAVERVRTGWRVVGYDVPVGRRTRFFAWVFPEREHVHLGFVHGVLMRDRNAVLAGAGITKLARWVTFEPGEPVDPIALTPLVLEAVRVTGLPRAERELALSLVGQP